MKPKDCYRSMSCDGMTIAAMILVNNPAVWGKAYAPLQHAFWHGMTPTDLIYPFFVFIMGVSAFFSLSKRYEGVNRGAFPGYCAAA